MDNITNTEDTIDSRDIIERIEELESLKEDERLEAEAEGGEFNDDAFSESEELEALKKLAEEASLYNCDFDSGATLINEEYFTEYCRELVSDTGDLPRNLPDYIARNIDWGGVAEDLRADYTEVDFDGTTFLIRTT